MALRKPSGGKSRLHTPYTKSQDNTSAEHTLATQPSDLKPPDLQTAQQPMYLSDKTLPSTSSHRPNPTSASSSHLETLPVEVFNQILSCLAHPRSRLAGLTERQSTCGFSKEEQGNIIGGIDPTTPPDTGRFAADLFAWTDLRHPFNTLAATSKRCQALVESYGAHLMKGCTSFNLPFDHIERFGPKSVYPDFSKMVYRRLWLQTAPRYCVFCGQGLSCYPHKTLIPSRLIIACGDCFYAQTLDLQEVQTQYHISDPSVLKANRVSASGPNFEWILRTDVEELALKLYGTRAFHCPDPRTNISPCQICSRAGIANVTVEVALPQMQRSPSHATRTARAPRRRR